MLTIIPSNIAPTGASAGVSADISAGVGAFAHPDARHGYGVFETLRAERAGSRSEPNAPFRVGLLRLHYERLSAGAEFLGLGEPPPIEVLREAVEKAAEEFARAESDARPNAVHLIAINLVAVTGELRIFCRAAEPLGGLDSEGGARLVISRLVRRLSGSAVTRFKTLSYMDNRLLAREAALASATDALAPNERGLITDGGRFTVFALRGGRLLTPAALCGALPGVARRVFLEAGFAEEAELGTDDLLKAEVLFVANSLRGVLPVLALDSAPKPLNRAWLQKLAECYRAAAVG